MSEQVASVDAGVADGEGPLPISTLEAHGVPPADIKKLKTAGLHTVQSVCFSSRRSLCKINGISESKADKILTAGRKLIPTGFTTATALHLNRSQLVQVRSYWSTQIVFFGTAYHFLLLPHTFLICVSSCTAFCR